MKRFIIMSAIASVIVFSLSCKKNKKSESIEEVPNPLTPSYPSYSALKVGNYWIYEEFEVNEDGTYTSLHKIDSSYVEKDTVVGKYTYSKVRRKNFVFNYLPYLLLRDSLHYIVGPGGGVSFSSEDFTTVFQSFHQLGEPGDTIFKATTKMGDRDMAVTTPAGTFITSNMKTTYVTTPSHTPPGISNPRYMNMRYAKSIGLIVETEPFYLLQSRVTEKRLIRYHLN